MVVYRGHKISLAVNGELLINDGKNGSVANTESAKYVIDQLVDLEAAAAKAKSRNPADKPVKPVFETPMWVARTSFVTGKVEYERVTVTSATGGSYKLRVWYRNAKGEAKQGAGREFRAFRDEAEMAVHAELTAVHDAASKRMYELRAANVVRPAVARDECVVRFRTLDKDIAFNPELTEDLVLVEREWLPGQEFTSYYELVMAVTAAVCDALGYVKVEGEYVRKEASGEYREALLTMESTRQALSDLTSRIMGRTRDVLVEFSREMSAYKDDLDSWKRSR